MKACSHLQMTALTSAEMLLQKCKHLAPAVERLLGPVRHPIGVEERMPASVIAMKLVILSELLEHLLGAIDVIAIGVLVVIAENTEHRAAHLLGQLDRRDRPLGIELLLVVDDHIAAPAIDQRIDAGHAAGDEIGVAPA